MLYYLYLVAAIFDVFGVKWEVIIKKYISVFNATYDH